MTCRVIKLAVFAPPLSGHLYPVLGLMQPLLDNPNYDITVYTGVTKVPVVQALGFKCQALLPDQPDSMPPPFMGRFRLPSLCVRTL